MEVLAFLHHSIAYEHPEEYELQLTWGDLKTIPKAVLPDLILSGYQPSSQLSSQTAGYLLCLLGGMAILAASDSATAATLARGSHGDDVRQLQHALSQAGYFHGPFTGYYGSLTQSAVMAFQADHALSVDGVAGCNTQSALHPTPSTPVGGGNISYGMYGSDVLDLQYSLSNAGYFSGPFTGYFGEMTESAVMALQRDYGLRVDGVVGPTTRAALSGAGAPAAAPQSVASGSQSLRFGATGPAVNQLQRDLANAGFYSGPFTEYFGELTQAAVFKLQAAYGLSQDGIAGPNTQAALAQALAGSAPPVAAAPEPAEQSPEPQAPLEPFTRPAPEPVATAEPSPTATASPSPTVASPAPEPTPTSTVSEGTPAAEEGPLPAGFIELQTDLQAFDSPNGNPVESDYPLNAGQVLGYAEDRGDGWIRIVGAGNGDDAWIFAGDNYSGVEFRTSSQPTDSSTASPELSLEPPSQPEATNTAAASPSVNIPESFFVGPTSVELEQSLASYDAPNGTEQSASFAAGDKLNYVAARPDCWVLVEDEAGNSSWVFAGEGFGSLKFVNDALSGIEINPPTCKVSAN